MCCVVHLPVRVRPAGASRRPHVHLRGLLKLREAYPPGHICGLFDPGHICGLFHMRAWCICRRGWDLRAPTAGPMCICGASCACAKHIRRPAGHVCGLFDPGHICGLFNGLGRRGATARLASHQRARCPLLPQLERRPLQNSTTNLQRNMRAWFICRCGLGLRATSAGPMCMCGAS